MRNINRDWMRGRNGITANAWKGDRAGYHAIHIWLSKHYEKGVSCDQCKTTDASRLEWANISGEYKREREDYFVLCPSCHRLYDQKDQCRKGHPYKIETTHVNKRGHRRCLICKAEKERQSALN